MMRRLIYVMFQDIRSFFIKKGGNSEKQGGASDGKGSKKRAIRVIESDSDDDVKPLPKKQKEVKCKCRYRHINPVQLL